MTHPLALLPMLADGQVVSGAELARAFQISRATVSNWVVKLEDYGLEISKVRGRGYRLMNRLDLLDPGRLRSSLISSPAAFARLDYELESDSTNNTAMTDSNVSTAWTLYTTEFQHQGKGRRGKAWQASLGASLLFSMSCRKQWPIDVIYLASILTGIAVARTLAQCTPQADIKVKWPNDIYIDGQKLAGILCELQGNPVDESQLVIGVGLNVYEAPEGDDINATCLTRFGRQVPDRTELLSLLVAAIAQTLERAEQMGVQAELAHWPQLDYLFEKNIRVLQGERVIEGRAKGIDDKGQLRVLIAGELKTFNGGEVSVRW